MITDSLRASAVTGGGTPPPTPPRSAPRTAAERLSGLSCGEFAERFWGRRPLVVKSADARGFSDLLDLDGVDELLCRRGLRTPSVRLVRNGSVIDSAAFTAPGGPGAEIGDQVRDDKIIDLSPAARPSSSKRFTGPGRRSSTSQPVWASSSGIPFRSTPM